LPGPLALRMQEAQTLQAPKLPVLALQAPPVPAQTAR